MEAHAGSKAREEEAVEFSRLRALFVGEEMMRLHEGKIHRVGPNFAN